MNCDEHMMNWCVCSSVDKDVMGWCCEVGMVASSWAATAELSCCSFAPFSVVLTTQQLHVLWELLAAGPSLAQLPMPGSYSPVDVLGYVDISWIFAIWLCCQVYFCPSADDAKPEAQLLIRTDTHFGPSWYILNDELNTAFQCKSESKTNQPPILIFLFCFPFFWQQQWRWRKHMDCTTTRCRLGFH